MNKEELKTKIREILVAYKSEDDWSFSAEDAVIEIAIGSDEIDVEISSSYNPPPFNSGVILALCDLFDTMNIDEEQFSYGGCETCDWGSSYGYTLTIKESKLVIEE